MVRIYPHCYTIHNDKTVWVCKGTKKSYPLDRGGRLYAAVSCVSATKPNSSSSRSGSSSGSPQKGISSSSSSSSRSPDKTPGGGRRRRTTVAANAHRTLVVEVLRASGITNLNTFTAMDPYTVAKLESKSGKGNDAAYQPRAGDYSGLASRGATHVVEGM
jgi:hypothetical protein